MRVAVVGSGYVGLVVGACVADAGNDVACVDTDARKVAALRRGRIPIYEPGLDELVRRNVRQRRLSFLGDVAAAGRRDVYFIAVGTPPGEDGSADVRRVLEAARQIRRALRGDAVVVLKSTVPVGTNERVTEVLTRGTRFEVEVVSNPEFLKEGAAIHDFLEPDRVVVGTESPWARAVMAQLYAPFVSASKPLVFMDPRSAELTKYAANAMLATRISFMNEVATLCERVGADVELVRRGVGADWRIGRAFLSAGVGYGGSCFPKDIRALLSTARQHDVDLGVLEAVERANVRQKRILVSKAQRHYGRLGGKFFALWGLSFKPDTDDMREAPAIEVIEGLLAKGARVRAHDPVAEPVAERRFGERVLYAPSIYDCVEGTDGLFVVTEWSQFRHPDLRMLRSLMRTPVIFDGRNVLDPERVRAAGFVYYGVGRP